MNITLDQIDTIRIASPCSMAWDDMEGDGAVRHCSECKLNVHNLSDMSRQEIADLLGNAEGRVCGRLYRRADGTILTRDCPVGLAKVRRGTAWMLTRVGAVTAVLVTAAMVIAQTSENNRESIRLRTVQPFTKLASAIDPASAPVAGRMIMGDLVCPTPTGQTTTP